MEKRKKIIVSIVALVWVLVIAGLGIWLGVRHQRASGLLEEVGWYNLEDDKFTITTSDELFDVAALSQYYDFKGQTICLGADIVINDGEASEWEENAPQVVWTPITRFAGTFDGDGHTISGVYALGVNSSVGLFTNTQATSVICNLNLENSYFQGLNDKGTGSIVGCGSGTLDTIYSNAIVECKSDNCGGLVGYMEAGKTNVIQNCWFDGIVKSTSGLSSCTGGLVGKVLSNTSLCKILHCLNTGEVTSLGEEVGGIAGAVAGETTVWLTDCLTVGKVQGAEDSITVGMVIGKVYDSVKVNARESWFAEGDYANAVGDADGTISGLLVSISKDELLGFDAYINTTLDFEEYWAVVEKDTPILMCFAETTPSVSGLERKLDVSWFDEKAMQMHIKTVAQLNGFALLSQAYGFSGQTVVLDNDLVLNEGKAKDWAKTAPENEWTLPIGRGVNDAGITSGVTFAGTFDGGGHTISGLYSKLDTGKTWNFGLFSKISGTIKNLRLENSYIGGKAGGHVGSIAGSSSGATLENVYSNAIVNVETEKIGGLVGLVESEKTETTITNCWFDGSVSGKQFVGGFVGRANQETTITIHHGLNSGDVTSEGDYVGGLCGIINKCTATITDSLNTGTVSTTGKTVFIGAIAGGVNGSAEFKCHTTLKDVFYLNTSCEKAYKVDGNNKQHVTLVGTGVIQVNEKELTGNNAYVWTTLDFKNYWTTVKSDMPELRTLAATTQKVSGKRMVDYSWYNINQKNHKISDAEDLYGLSFVLRNDYHKDHTITLAKDIVLNDTTQANWYEASGLTNWKPIGRYVDEDGNTVGEWFAGTFDGAGHTITGLYGKLNSTKVYNWGLFGKTSGTIKNLTLKDGYIAGVAGAQVGSVAGSITGATLENIYSNVMINVDAEKVGGLAGINEGVDTESTITNCWFDGSVSGKTYVGGLVGRVNEKTTLTIAHGLNSGDVTSSGDYVGGLCGLVNKCTATITDSLNTGTVSTTGKTSFYGAIAGGVNGGKGAECLATFNNVFFLDDSCDKGYKVDGNNVKYIQLVGTGAIQMQEEELTGKNAYTWTTLDFKDYWTTVEKDMPVLRTFVADAQTVSGDRMVAFDWYDLSKTKYQISNAEELWGFTILSRTDDFNKKTVTLTKDITLDDTNWKPIGRFVDEEGNVSGQMFNGTFDGAGHKITGLCIHSDSTKAYNLGLFGKTSGTIQNLRLENSSITGTAGGNVGSIAGSISGATLENIYSNAEVNVKVDKVGGFAGLNEGAATESTITNCWFDGSVSGKSFVGGFVGRVDANTGLTITHGLNSGEVTSSGDYVGGLCGIVNKCTATVEDSLNTGTVSATVKTLFKGAIAGGINGSATEECQTTLKNVYYLEDSCDKAYKVDENNEQYVTLTGTGVLSASNASLAGKNALKYTTLDFKDYWMTVDKAAPTLRLLTENAPQESVAANIDWYDMAGTEFMILEKEQLLGFALLSRTHDFAGQTIILGKDIALNDTSKDNWYENATSWEPIGRFLDKDGSKGEVFAGTFDGNNNEITGLCMKLDDAKTGNWGLFGKTSGNIQNLKLKDCYITGTADYNVGSVAGSMAGGSLTNVYVDTVLNVEADNVGGLIGQNEEKTTTITNCWTTGEVTGTAKVGGFVGWVGKQVDINHGLNSAAVTLTGANTYAGGFVGYASKTVANIEDSLNTGAITTTGTGNKLGTIVGAVNGWETKGVVTLTDVYYLEDGTLSPYNRINVEYTDVSGTGALGVSKTRLSGENALKYTTLDFEQYWMTVEGKTPTLRLLVGDALAGSVVADIDWYNTSKTEFTISTKEELWGLALLSRYYDFAGQTIRLGKDISLNNTSADNWYENATSWEPIGRFLDKEGSKGKVFAGTFDGNNKKIIGLCIKLNDATAGNWGLFGKTSGNIQNLKLEDCYITGTADYNVGSVAGSMAGGSLTNVYVDTVLNVQADNVGGLIGQNEEKTTTITNCWTEGEVTGTAKVGGFVGWVGKQVDINHGLNSAAVTLTGASTYAGGFVGYASKTVANIEDCLNTGAITTTGTDNKLGTIVGAVNGWETKGVVTLTDVYYLEDGNLSPYNRMNMDYTDVSGTGALPVSATQLNGENALRYTTLDFKDYWMTVDGKAPTLRLLADNVASKNARADIDWYDTNETEFTISTKEELWGLSLLSRYYDFAGQKIILGQDIALNDTSTENWYESASDWEPIGSHSGGVGGKVFAGTFEGNSKKITGLCIKLNNGNAYNWGLFGKTSGTIQNLKLEDCHISGTAGGNIGSVAGSMAGGSLTNVYVDTNINISANSVGGLVGQNEEKSTTITNCWATGSVTGKQYVGGLIGKVQKPITIDLSVNNTAIHSTHASDPRAGGLCGQVSGGKAEIKNSLNTGKVTSKGGTWKGTLVGFLHISQNGELELSSVYYLKDSNLAIYVNNTGAELVTGSTQLSSTVDNTDISWFTDVNVKGDATDPYIISDKADLLGFAALSRIYDFAGKTVKIADDVEGITLNDTSQDTWTNNATSWEPIGSHSGGVGGKVFAGTFNGNNKKITGLCIKLNNTSAINWGLFGKTSGNIQNLTLEDCHISGTASNSIGSIAGSMTGGTLTNVCVDTYINITANAVGGLAGVSETHVTTITNCKVTGSVTGTTRVGGFVGDVAEQGYQLNIDAGVNNANVSATASTARVGGFLGRVKTEQSGVTITNSLNAGSVAGVAEVAAIIGSVNNWSATKTVSLENVYYLTDGGLSAYTTYDTTNVVTETNVEKLSSNRADTDISWFFEATGTEADPYTLVDDKDENGYVALSNIYSFEREGNKVWRNY